jgi:hypothetical protein
LKPSKTTKLAFSSRRMIVMRWPRRSLSSQKMMPREKVWEKRGESGHLSNSSGTRLRGRCRIVIAVFADWIPRLHPRRLSGKHSPLLSSPHPCRHPATMPGARRGGSECEAHLPSDQDARASDRYDAPWRSDDFARSAATIAFPREGWGRGCAWPSPSTAATREAIS